VNRRFVALLAGSIFGIHGCGGGGQADSGGAQGVPPPTVPPPPAGTPVTRSIGGLWSGGLWWDASAPWPAGATIARVLVAETGEFRIVMTSDPDGDEALFTNESEQISGTFGNSGANVVTIGDAIATMPLGVNNPTGDHFGDFAMSGRFDSIANFSGTFTSFYTSFLERRGKIGFTYHSIYEWPSSLARLSGNFTTTSASLSIDSQGIIFFQSAANGCTGNGQAEIIDSRYNMYRLTIIVASCTGIDAVRNGLTFTGLANLGLNNNIAGDFINETVEMALSASRVAAPSGYINWNFLAHRR
jgi:hypothetical protein